MLALEQCCSGALLALVDGFAEALVNQKNHREADLDGYEDMVRARAGRNTGVYLRGAWVLRP